MIVDESGFCKCLIVLRVLHSYLKYGLSMSFNHV